MQVMNRDDDETALEITALTRVQPHPHIVTLMCPPEYSADSAFLVLEYCETDLLEVIVRAANGGESSGGGGGDAASSSGGEPSAEPALGGLPPEATAARYFIQVRV